MSKKLPAAVGGINPFLGGSSAMQHECSTTIEQQRTSHHAILLLTGRIIHLNRRDLPGEPRDLPAGRYAVEPVDEVPDLTRAEEDGLHRALDSIRAGKGQTLDQVRRTVDAALEK